MLSEVRLPDDATVVNGRTGLPRMGERFDPNWVRPGADQASTRGFSETIYPKVAPAVIVVKFPQGHGTGFVVDPDGWILTNNHVAAVAAPDPATGVPTADILFGKLEDRWMKLQPDPVKAQVYKLSPAQDLALLKLVEKPRGMEKLASVPLARQSAGPGAECVAIGHPAASALWSVRSGEVTGEGMWPGDRTEVILRLLSLKKPDADELAQQLKQAPNRKIVLTNTGINSGDSGGPLVNKNGELIGVTYAMPAFTADEAGRQGTTSYHIHLDEVKAFLRDRPAEPLLQTDPWPDAMLAGVLTVRGYPALAFAADRESRPLALLVDLARGNGAVDVRTLADPARRNQWAFQFGIHSNPAGQAAKTFYDTDGGHGIDLILTDLNGDGVADVALRRTDGKWKAEPAEGRRMVDPGHFTSPALTRAMAAFLGAGNVGPARKPGKPGGRNLGE